MSSVRTSCSLCHELKRALLRPHRSQPILRCVPGTKAGGEILRTSRSQNNPHLFCRCDQRGPMFGLQECSKISKTRFAPMLHTVVHDRETMFVGSRLSRHIVRAVQEDASVCPLCCEQLDETEKNHRPCPCGYEPPLCRQVPCCQQPQNSGLRVQVPSVFVLPSEIAGRVRESMSSLSHCVRHRPGGVGAPSGGSCARGPRQSGAPAP
jgi:hypothetical protein